MPAICDSITSKISENLSQSFKKTEKENFENHLTPTAKQVLTTKIEYEPVANYTNSILSSLQTKYIVLKPNQPALSANGNATKSFQNTNEKSHPVNGNSTSSNQLPQPKKTLFPRESVQVGWNNIGRSWSPGCGFHNVGNTCYLNSTLQAFFHVPAVAHWLISDREHREKGNCQNSQICIICAMSQTLISSQRQQHSMTPSLITNRLQTICRHLTLGRQEDAHEFLRYLVEQMEKAYLNRFKAMLNFKELDQYSKETTPLNQILGGYLRSTVTCLACKHESITFQHFEDLQLDITRVSTLHEALAGYFSRENLEECGYKCESCKRKVSATKRFSLERAPVVLCIQLKRFNVMGGKLGKQIQISQNMDLQKHLAKSCDPTQSCYYRLVSLVTHLGGSASGGHYTAIGLTPNGNYYQFDDSCVSPISTESVLRTNAYLLFYELLTKQKNHSLHNFNAIHQNEHTYSKCASSPININNINSPLSSTTNRSDFDRLRENNNFAKPILPKMIPLQIARQNIKQKENETTPPQQKNGNSLINNQQARILNGKTPSQLFSAVKLNGKRSASDEDDDKDLIVSKKQKPSLPSLPRLTSDEIMMMKQTLATVSSSTSSSPSTTPVKPKSLVPYGTDDEDDDQVVSTSKCETDSVYLCRTSSGVFVETDLNIVGPSKQGSTVDKTVVTKASVKINNGTNGNVKDSNCKVSTNGYHNGKKTEDQSSPPTQKMIKTSYENGKSNTTNGYHVKRNDDTLQQLTKLNHSGYGTSDVLSWNQTPSQMSREVEKDQHEDRKRQSLDTDDVEMDAGRTKKLKFFNRHQSSHQGKLPNPFQGQQNNQNLNGNGNYRHHQQSSYNDRGNSFNRGFSNGGNNRNKFKNSFKRDNYYQNGHNRHNGPSGQYNNNKRYFNSSNNHRR